MTNQNSLDGGAGEAAEGTGCCQQRIGLVRVGRQGLKPNSFDSDYGTT